MFPLKTSLAQLTSEYLSLMQLTSCGLEISQNYTLESGSEGNVTLSIPWQLFSEIENDMFPAGTEAFNHSMSRAHSFSIITDARTPIFIGNGLSYYS